MKTRHEILMESPEYRRLYAIEGLVTDAAELVARLMQEQGINKAELARRLGKSRAWVTQLLNGKANMTMRTLAELAYVLGAEVDLAVQQQPTKKKSESVVRTKNVLYEIPNLQISLKDQPESWSHIGEQHFVRSEAVASRTGLEYAA